MKRVVSGAIVVAALVFAGSLVSAQAPAQGQPGQGRGAGGGRGGAPQPPPTNLQVLPKDWTRQQVVQVMQQINAGLGVQCGYCHMFTAAGDPTNDFAADVKPTKNVARAMMRMVQDVNKQVAAAVPSKASDQVARVGCATCHRGAAIPVVAPGTPGAPPPPAAPGAPGGAPGGAAPGGAPGPGRAN